MPRESVFAVLLKSVSRSLEVFATLGALAAGFFEVFASKILRV